MGSKKDIKIIFIQAITALMDCTFQICGILGTQMDLTREVKLLERITLVGNHSLNSKAECIY